MAALSQKEVDEKLINLILDARASNCDSVANVALLHLALQAMKTITGPGITYRYFVDRLKVRIHNLSSYHDCIGVQYSIVGIRFALMMPIPLLNSAYSVAYFRMAAETGSVELKPKDGKGLLPGVPTEKKVLVQRLHELVDYIVLIETFMQFVDNESNRYKIELIDEYWAEINKDQPPRIE